MNRNNVVIKAKIQRPSREQPFKMLTIREVADYLSLSQRTVYRLIEERAIPALKVGGQWRFEQRALEKWVEAEISNHHEHRRHRNGPRIETAGGSGNRIDR